MASSMQELADDHVDDHVDEEIIGHLTSDNPKSFFLFAGAGSGKTRTLVLALDELRKEDGRRLRLQNRRVGVITYTNAARDEIEKRIDSDPLIHISTIHSFAWSLIGGFDKDIKEWLEENLNQKINALEEQRIRSRPGTKKLVDCERNIKQKRKRLAILESVRHFSYNPNGENIDDDSLNHSEVIQIGADFIQNKPLMQKILMNRFPILLIDESQDTNKYFMEALLAVQRQRRKGFVLGLLGDTMQRIYGDGKADLGRNLPDDWVKPVKQMNHRSPVRIIKLINRIRSTVDGQVQKSRIDKEEGLVRLFIADSDLDDKARIERAASQRMAEITKDTLWIGPNAEVKTLILEHHMAAKRMDFLPMFEALYEVETLRTGLLDGSLPSLRLFSEILFPLVSAKNDGNEFAATAIVRKYSPLLHKATLKAFGDNQLLQIRRAREALDELHRLWQNNGQPRFLDVLRAVRQTGLFVIPEVLRPIADRTDDEQQIAEMLGDVFLSQEDSTDSTLEAWEKFLQTPFAQIGSYVAYVNGLAPFDTHQGVKGLEFPRVMTIIDDNTARGFLFQYEKLFGAKNKTATDLKNEAENKDTSIDRTRRLFYVTCSRAKKSLAIVAYSSDPRKIRDHILHEQWFEPDEVEFLN